MCFGWKPLKFPRVPIAILPPNAGRCCWLNSVRHGWHVVPIWEPLVTYQWQRVHSSSIQSCCVYTGEPLTDAACPRGPSIYDCPSDFVYTYVCFHHVSDVNMLPSAWTPAQHWWNWLCNLTFLVIFLFYSSGCMLALDWNYSLFLPHIHALATPIIFFFLCW